MPTRIALELIEIPLVDRRPYLHFSSTQASIFKLLVPDAEVVTGAIKTVYRGETFKVPTVIPPGRSIATIEQGSLPGFDSFHPYHKYVLLEADEAQSEQVAALCQSSRYLGNGAYFAAEARWWHFPLNNGTPAKPLDTSHMLYSMSPPAGWTAPAYEIDTDQSYWIGISGNYGTEVKRHEGRVISALKVSQTAFNNLMALFGDQMINLTTPRSSYRYFIFKSSAVLAHKDSHCFYFQISGQDLQAFSAHTAKSFDERCYLWLADEWLTLPSAAGSYAGTLGGTLPMRPTRRDSAPKWTPPGAQRAAQRDIPANNITYRGHGLTVRYSKRYDHEPGWWWIQGDNALATKSIRYELRSHGCEWSKRQQQWYYKGDTLPAALQTLLGIHTTATPATAPASPPSPPSPPPPVAENEPELTYKPGQVVATRHPVVFSTGGRDYKIPVNAKTRIVSGTASMSMKATYQVQYPNHSGDIITNATEDSLWPISFQPGEYAWSSRDLKLDPEGEIDTGTALTVVDYLGGVADSWDTFYEVRFDGIEGTYEVEGRFINRDQPFKGIRVRGGDIFGNRNTVKRHTRIESRSLPPAPPADLPVALPAPEAPPTDARASELAALSGISTPDAAAPALPDRTEQEKPPSLTIRTAEALFTSSENAVKLRHAITAAAAIPPSVSVAPTAYGKAIPIPQDYVGELTGSITGDVHCYGYAVDHNTCIWLNMAGPRTAVEAIRAKLTLGDIVNLTRWDAPSVELTAGEGQKGMYSDFPSNMSDRKFYNTILVHALMAAPIYAERSTTYVIALDENAASAKVYDHLKQLLGITVFPVWRDYLWAAGRSAALIRACECGGGLQTYALTLDQADWTTLIAGALQQQVIHLPA